MAPEPPSPATPSGPEPVDPAAHPQKETDRAEGDSEGQGTDAQSGTPDVFVSYASQDAALANDIVATLERNGLRCWIAPRDVTPGGHYADAIMTAISGAKALVLLLSDSALASKHVGKEIERASSKGRAIIALRTTVTPLTPAFEYFLSESQWIDVGSGGIDAAAAKLIEAIRSHLTPGTSSVPAKPLAVDRKAAPSQPRWIAIGAVGLLTITLAYFVAPKFWLTKHAPAEHPSTATSPTAAISDKSIAVLPFVDMSEKHDQEYMSDGIAEELLNLLAQAPGLKVIARTSSFAFKGKAIDIAEIARRLNVAHVLEGSVRKSGNRIRITAQLIRTADSTHLWSETYDRPLKDIFAVQDEIAGAIAQALQIQLAGGELSRRKGGTQNLEAYQLYLRALSPSNQNSRASLDTAGDYLEQAIKLDPGYGLAWSQLAWVFTLKTVNNWLNPTEGYGRARQLAQHALQLSPDQAEAHAALMFVYRSLDWDWAAAEVEGRQALAIDPTNPDALDVAGNLSITLGRWNDAERQLRTALVRDPLNAIVFFDLGNTYYLAGRFKEAEGMYRRVIELAPQSGWTTVGSARRFSRRARRRRRWPWRSKKSTEEERLGYLPIFLQAVGRQAEADAALQAQIAQWADTCAFALPAPTPIAAIAIMHSNGWNAPTSRRTRPLPKSLANHCSSDLHADPRYKAFLRKMNLPE